MIGRYTGKAAGIVLAVLLAAGISGCGAEQQSGAVKETMRPFAVRQIVAADNETGRTVMWQLPKGGDNTLEYRKKGSGEIRSVKADGKTLKGNRGISDSTLYTARLTNLQKGTDYEYRTRSGNEVSPWYSLKTDDGKAFKALITSDSQSSDYSDWEKLFRDAYSRNPDISFFVDLGDIVDNGQDEYQWQAWFRTVKDVIEKVPAAPVLGNHEAYSLDWKTAMPERYLAHFQLPSNGNENHQGHYYSYDWGDVHFAVLDTSETEEGEWLPDLFAKEKEWLANDLKSTDKKWKVVLMHKDPLQYSFADTGRPAREEGFSFEGREFMPILEENGADLVLSAHLHTYRDRGHIENFARSDKGPVYVIVGLGGNVRYPGLWKRHSLDEYAAPQPETNNYSILEATEDALILTGYLPDGTELHRTVVRKDS